MPIPDPKKDQSKTMGDTQKSGHALDRYTVTPKSSNDENGEKSPFYRSQAPSISLPKGGGAIKGIDEKFTVNAANGTSSLSVPLPLTPGRSGFTPSLALQYNSGSGNSEFGLGWGMSLPSIQRRTDKKLPLYQDDEEQDVFILAGAEDLVPLLVTDGDDWIPEVITHDGFEIKRYRPRIEGLFARIEFIHKLELPDRYWKVITKDNVVTFYGYTAEARIADPEDGGRIFKWLPQVSYDDKGNVMVYTYVTDTDTDIVPSGLHEQNRKNGLAPFTNTYLSDVAYCNRTPYIVATSEDPIVSLTMPDPEDFLMRCVLDYGGHDAEVPAPGPVDDIPMRRDAFSDFHACFEVRTYRRCKRALMFHYFDELDGGDAVLVRSLDLTYVSDAAPEILIEADQILSITQRGYVKNGSSGYHVKAMPPLEFVYSAVSWNKDVHNSSQVDMEHAPQGLTGPYQWIDLWGEGLPGILSEQANGWFYKGNKGGGHFDPAVAVAERPTFQGLGGDMQWQDLNADGRRQLVSRGGMVHGFFELDDDQQWQAFRSFREWANIDWSSPYTRVLDLNGDGRPDVLLTEDIVWKWYENAGTDGYKEGGCGPVFLDEEKGPVLLHNDMMQAIFMADMNGDGLTDLVRIQNGEVCYWPNKGYGKFGARVTMSNAPIFDISDIFDPQRIVLADITGTGAPDLLYFAYDKCTAWLNLSGNAWGEGEDLPSFAGAEPHSKVTAMDFLGKGTSCIVWSSPLPGNANAPLRYIDLMGEEGKPYLLTSYSNSMGKTVAVEYTHSTSFYLEDKLQGSPWATRLPFPVHCVSKQTIGDTISQTSYATSYTYHHGYYDHEEREFRGFGRVDTYDTDVVTDEMSQWPVKTKTWYHTGAWVRGKVLTEAFAKEYTSPDWAELTSFIELPAGLNAQETREAYRALKGLPLRQEVYALDEIDDPNNDGALYTIATNAYCVKVVQALAGNRFASFYAYKQQTLSYSCERDTTDPRVLHDLVLGVDEYGNTLLEVKVAYPRSSEVLGGLGLPTVVAETQAKMHVTYTAHRYTNDVTDIGYRLRLLCETKTYQVTAGFATETYGPANSLWTVGELYWLYEERNLIPFSSSPVEPYIQFRLLGIERTLYLKNELGTLSLGYIESLGILNRKYTLAFTGDMLTGSPITEAMLTEGGYVPHEDIDEFEDSYDSFWMSGDYYWLPSGTVSYDATHFYTPLVYKDPWDNETLIHYSDAGTGEYYLLPYIVTDALGNSTTVNEYNWYNLQPTQITDINNNQSHITYNALGLPVAVAIMEKDGSGTGDTLSGIDPTDTSGVSDFFADPISNAPAMLQGASWRCIYRFELIMDGDPASWQYPCVAMIAREQHNSDNPSSPLIMRFSYADGLGRVAMHKVQAAPPEGETTIRWIASGKTIYNNKGNAVMQYEPYYTATHSFDGTQAAETVGVTPRMHYDPLGRLYRTDLPDGTYTTTVWTPWLQKTWDNNDTVHLSLWHSIASSGTEQEQDAAAKAIYHADTPTTVHLDTLARPFFTIQIDGLPNPDDVPKWMYPEYESYVVLDIQGNRREIHDARGLTAITYTHNMLQAVIQQVSMDSGTQHILADAGGQPLYSWDADNREFYYTYDNLRRVVAKQVTPPSAGHKVLERYTYGEGATDDYVLNLRGKPIKIYDGAGSIDFVNYDFKGNPLHTVRTFTTDYEFHPDWTTPGSVPMESESYTGETTYDALSRPITVTTPDGGVTTNAYNQSGQLYNINVNVPNVGGTLSTDIINEIYYNARGQRTKVKFENGATTTYEYDPNTFRVTRIRTTRYSDSQVLQDLNYWYDPVGNITWQTDDAQDVVFYDGSMAEPTNKYTYDALYRLIQCDGREHASVTGAVTYNDDIRVGNVPLPSDASAMRRYTQLYSYDQTGNMLEMKHITTGSDSWTRTFTVDDYNNRLTDSDIGSDGSGSGESYSYDTRGNMIAGVNNLSPLSGSPMIYDEENRLRFMKTASSTRIYYQYDFNGQRVRKYTLPASGYLNIVRLYIGGWEQYREFNPTTHTIELERQTLHVMDDAGRVAIIDTPIIDLGGSGELQTLHYQFSNHLGTASLELDEDANIISYEEYYPFGNTSYQAGRNATEVSLKRYRFVDKERDDESGFYYMGARYYCPWLARWLAPDPINGEWYNLSKGTPTRNVERQFVELTASSYEYCYANPVRFTDPSGEQPPASAPIEPDVRPRPAQDNLPPQQGKPLGADDHIPTTQLEKGQISWRNAHPKGGTISGPTPTTASESTLHKMTPQERKLHEEVRAQKMELAGRTPEGDPTGATKLAQNKHWQGLAENIVLPTLEAASIVDGVGAVRNLFVERRAFSILKGMEANTPGAHYLSRHGAQTTLTQQYIRATTGMAPDMHPPMKMPKPMSGSRFLTHTDQLEAAKIANDIYLQTGQRSFPFSMERTIGEGYKSVASGAPEYKTTTDVIAVFKNGNLSTMYPKIIP